MAQGSEAVGEPALWFTAEGAANDCEPARATRREFAQLALNSVSDRDARRGNRAVDHVKPGADNVSADKDKVARKLAKLR